MKNRITELRTIIMYLKSDNYDFITLSIEYLEKHYVNKDKIVKFIRRYIPVFSDNQVYNHDNKIYLYSIQKDDLIAKLKPMQMIYNIAMNKMKI